MRLVWIIDNKYRELYGLYDLKKELKKKNIFLIFIHKINWRSSIDLINPSGIILPNLSERFGEIILNYAKTKNIRVFYYPSEGLDSSKEFLNHVFPKRVINKVDHFLLWSKTDKLELQKRVKITNNFSIVGNLRFLSLKKQYPKKISKVGIISSNKTLASKISKNLVKSIYRRTGQKELIDQIKTEFDYIHKVFEIINELKKNKYKIKFKIHPFEDPEKYEFLDKEELEYGNIHEFLKKVDVVLNLYSSGSIEAFTGNVPVISLKNLIPIKRKRLKNIISTEIGLKPKSINNLISLLTSRPKNLQKKIKTKKNIAKVKKSIEFEKDLTNFIQSFLKLKIYDKKNFVNFFYLPKYILSEVKSLLLFRGYSLFRFYNPLDNFLLKKYKIKK